jgi:hypothetical protein
VTCWRRLRDWTEVGVWPRLHEILASTDASSVLVAHAEDGAPLGRRGPPLVPLLCGLPLPDRCDLAVDALQSVTSTSWEKAAA